MAHYKNNNNKTSFIPTENKKKKKKFTKEQLIVFILMIFWSISSVLGIIAFTSNVVNAEEPLTVYAEEPDYNYSPPKYNDVNYNEFNPCNYPTMNLLGADYMVNDTFQYDNNNNRYLLTRNENSFVSEWFYFPFTLYEGDYIATIEDFFNSSSGATQISLQFQTFNYINYYVRFNLSSSLGTEDISVSFNLSNVTGSPIIAKNIDKVRFVCSNTYEVGTFFYFRNPTLYCSDIAYPYSPYFGTYCDIASDYAYEKGWQDSGEAYDEGYDEGYDIGYSEGFNQSEEDFNNLYGGLFGGIFTGAEFTVHLFSEHGNAQALNSTPDLYFDYGLDFNRFLNATLTNNSTGVVEEVNSISVTILLTSPYLYSTQPLYTLPFLNKNMLLSNTITTNGVSLHNCISSNDTILYGEDFLGFKSYGRILTSQNDNSLLYPDIYINKIIISFYDNENAIIVSPLGVSNRFYDKGFEDGLKEAMSTDAYIQALQDAKDIGKALGYNEGVQDANNYTFLSLFGAVVDAPLNVFTRMFDFEILGFNMKSLYLSLFTACLLIVIIKKVI